MHCHHTESGSGLHKALRTCVCCRAKGTPGGNTGAHHKREFVSSFDTFGHRERLGVMRMRKNSLVVVPQPGARHIPIPQVFDRKSSAWFTSFSALLTGSNRISASSQPRNCSQLLQQATSTFHFTFLQRVPVNEVGSRKKHSQGN